MSSGRILTPFYDLKEKSAGKSGFFFLEHILRARVDLHYESADDSLDQELNVYIAGLLNSLVYNGDHLQQKPYISPFDYDIQKYLAAHPGLRSAYTVYRENADTELLLTGLFNGCRHSGSYHRRVVAHHDEAGRIALYYEIAASALAHLQGNNMSLVEVLEALSGHIEMILEIIHYTASSYFDLMERMSEGTVFHLEREIDLMEKETLYQQKLDEFLKAYSLYTENPTDAAKAELFLLAQEVRRFKKDFRIEL